MAPKDYLMNRAETAEYIGTTVGTLATWACTKKVDIPFIRVGRAVRYRKSDVDRWLQTRQVNPLPPEGGE